MEDNIFRKKSLDRVSSPEQLDAYLKEKKSILKQYYDALDVYKDEYIVEKIEDGFRKKYENF